MYVNLTRNQLDKKINAMKCYETEYNEMVRWRGEDGITTWARFFWFTS